MLGEKIYQELKDKRILVYGLGREGKSTLQFLESYRPVLKSLDWVDDAKERISNQTQVNAASYSSIQEVDLNSYDWIIKSPGIPLSKLPESVWKKVTSQLDLYLRWCEGKVIGITGTKGKSTTAALLYHVLSGNGGRTVLLVGNIGAAALDFLKETTPNTLTVYEMSSGQLECAHQSPHVAVLLSLYPEHLDYHASFEAYAQAKLNIARNQPEDGILFYHSIWQPYLKDFAIRAKQIMLDPLNLKIHHLSRELAKRGVYVHPVTLDAVQKVADYFGVSFHEFEEKCLIFQPLEHRLRPLKSASGILYYDDLLATLPEATLASIDLMRPHTLILGGYDRGLNWKAFAEALALRSLSVIIAMPDTGTIILKYMEEMKWKGKYANLAETTLLFAETVVDVVKLAEKETPPGAICLISPAAPSYNQFKNYEAKAKAFCESIEAIAESI